MRDSIFVVSGVCELMGVDMKEGLVIDAEEGDCVLPRCGWGVGCGRVRFEPSGCMKC